MMWGRFELAIGAAWRKRGEIFATPYARDRQDREAIVGDLDRLVGPI
jgi:hypothetical protein